MKRSTRKIIWQRTNKDYAIGVVRQRGKPDCIVIKIRKEALGRVNIAMDTVPPMEREPEKKVHELMAEREERMKMIFQHLGLAADQMPKVDA